MSGITAARNDAASLLEILQNSELLEKRLTQLREAETRANEVIALAGPASEIVQIREQLEEEREVREKLMVEATGHCDKIVEEAEKQAHDLILVAQEDAASAKSAAESILVRANDKLNAAENEAAKTERFNTELQQSKASCEAREEQFNAQILELEEERQLLQAERKKLAEVRTSITALLG